MNGTASARDGSVIIAEMLTLTNRMLEQRHDADFLTGGVEQRQKLIEEYQRFYQNDPDRRKEFEKGEQARQSIAKILSMDKVISAALLKHKNEAQAEVANSNSQQKVLGYINNAISTSGSYMDYKK